MTFQPVCPWSLRVGREEGVSREAESCVVAVSVLCASPHQVPRLRGLRSGKENPRPSSPRAAYLGLLGRLGVVAGLCVRSLLVWCGVPVGFGL